MLDALKGLSEAEREYALKILQEIGQGSTNTLNDLKYADYKEPPVDIETFILDEKYLGKAWHTASGKLKLFPYWLEKLKQLFPDNLTTNVNNAIFSGARGLGKSEIAVTCLLYMMHRVMCMKNARDLLNIKPTEKICFAMMNITKTLAEDIAVSKFQNTVQLSPWFLERGTMTQKNNSPYWTPPDPIDVIVGSQPSHVIGQPIYACLDGDTIINTKDGDFPIKELDNKSIKVYNTDDNGNLVLSDECTVKLTKETCEEYQIELEDGTVIKCTPEHRFMLINGEYKQAKDLTEEDEILDFTPYGYIYQTTNLINSHTYVGQHKGTFTEQYLGSGDNIKKAVTKYGKENFKVEVKCWCRDKAELDDKERYYISLLNPTYNIASGGQGGYIAPHFDFSASTKRIRENRSLEKQTVINKKISDTLKNKWANDKKYSSRVRKSLKKANAGPRVFSESHYNNLVKAIRSRTDYSNCHGNIDKKAITDGYVLKYIPKDDPLPIGWEYGNPHTSGKHDMSNYYSNEEMIKHRREISMGSNNSNYGNHKLAGGANPKANKYYIYNNIRFECRKDLLEYLHTNVDPKISANLLRHFEENTCGIRQRNKYAYVLDNLVWGYKSED